MAPVRIRKSIKLFAAAGILAMLLLGLFLWWDFSGPYRDWGSGSWSISDLWDPIRSFFDFESRRIQKCYKTLPSYIARVDELLKAEPNDLDLAMCRLDFGHTKPGGIDDANAIAAILRKWPRYGPALIAQAVFELDAVWSNAEAIGEFDDALRRDPNEGMMLLCGYSYMLTKDDPFVRVITRPGPADSNEQYLQVTDLAAARAAIIQRNSRVVDEAIARIRLLAAQDPNNAMYDFLIAECTMHLQRNQESIRLFRSLAGRKMNSYEAERRACMSRAMDKAAFPAYLRQFVEEQYPPLYGDTLPSYAINSIRDYATTADERGDPNTAKALRDLAQYLIDSVPDPNRPPSP
jgi:hypothetical protein